VARLEVLRSADYVTVPWKNGGGTTQDVARHPALSEDFAWRISIAAVASDGPFSAFPGVDRILTLIEPAGVALTVDGVEHELRYLKPFAFAGDVASSARLLAGATRDLNLMTSRGVTEGSVEIGGSDPAALEAGEGATVVAVAVAGRATVAAAGLEPVILGPLDSVRLNGPGTCLLKPESDETRVAIVRLATR
jgi:uncharacterized protein